jgi:hypothetical protein
MAASAFRSELELYAPVKAFLERQGYEVKGEVRGCDLVALRGDEPPVIVELKLRFGLALVLQGIDRLALTDAVYLAVPAATGPRAIRSAEHPDVKKLCRRLGFGLMTVAAGRRAARVEVLLDPVPYRPRRDKRRLGLLLGEHARRVGDPNRGGSTRVPLVTAYRQEALRCAEVIHREGPSKVAAIRLAGDAPRAGKILLDNVYGWFERVERGIYRLTPAGIEGLLRFGEARQAA